MSIDLVEDITFQSKRQHPPNLKTYYNQCAITIKAIEPGFGKGVGITAESDLNQSLPLSSAITSRCSSKSGRQCTVLGDKKVVSRYL